MSKLNTNLRRVLDYVLGVGLFLLAFALTNTSVWFRSHYPYLGYFAASLLTCYLFGLWPANVVAILAAVAVYASYAPAGFFVSSTQTPAILPCSCAVKITPSAVPKYEVANDPALQ